MNGRANPTIIGAFVVVAAVLGVAGVFLFGGGRLFSDSVKFVTYFQGSLRGLSEGSPVTLRGIEVGSVSDIQVQLETDDLELRVPVIIEIDRNRLTAVHHGRKLEEKALADRGLRAQLQVRSFVTGTLEVALDFHPDTPVNLLGRPGRYPELPTIASPTEELSRTLRDLPIREMSDSLLRTTRSLEELLNSKRAPAMLESVTDAAQEARKLLAEAREQMPDLLSQAQAAFARMEAAALGAEGSVETLSADAAALSEEARIALRTVRSTMASVENLAADSAELRAELARTLQELSASARALRTLADYLQQHPEAILRGKERH